MTMALTENSDKVRFSAVFVASEVISSIHTGHECLAGCTPNIAHYNTGTHMVHFLAHAQHVPL